MRARALFAALALAGCTTTPVATDTGGSADDAGHDAASAAPDTGNDANVAPADSGPMDCAADFAGCTTLEDHTGGAPLTISVGGSVTSPMYTPRCVRISAGTTVTLPSSATHPLGSASCSPADTPLDAPSTGGMFTFDHPGHYGFWCMNHGADDGSGMAGLIVVE